MACMDQTLWRDPSAPSPNPWSPIDKVPSTLPSDLESRGAMWFLITVLNNSHIYGAFNRRLAAALDAQARIASMTSLLLSPAQWRVEAENLFATSLARVQVDARNIARGVGATYDGYVKDNRSSEFCSRYYMFDTGGDWVNLNFVGWVCVLVVSLLLIICAVPVPEDKLFFEILPACLWNIGVCIMWLVLCPVDGWRWVWPYLRKAWQGVRSLC
jgi:hypothetical protein